MTLISENIKWLRKQKGLTQGGLAEAIDIKRSLVGAYEEGRADPRLHNLVKLAQLFQVSVDALISKDLINLDKSELEFEEEGRRWSGDQLRVLSLTVDQEEKENIELVPQKAAAGYLNGYADPEYVVELPKFQLPSLPRSGTYRAFEISGDSMLPLKPGTIVVGEYLSDWNDIKNGQTYVLLTRSEGVVYKRVFNYLKENKKLFLVSDNRSYAPYEIVGKDLLEVWAAKAFISVDFPDPTASNDVSFEKLADVVKSLQKEVNKLKAK